MGRRGRWYEKASRKYGYGPVNSNWRGYEGWVAKHGGFRQESNPPPGGYISYRTRPKSAYQVYMGRMMSQWRAANHYPGPGFGYGDAMKAAFAGFANSWRPGVPGYHAPMPQPKRVKGALPRYYRGDAAMYAMPRARSKLGAFGKPLRATGRRYGPRRQPFPLPAQSLYIPGLEQGSRRRPAAPGAAARNYRAAVGMQTRAMGRQSALAAARMGRGLYY
jgi:hypothetical protein